MAGNSEKNGPATPFHEKLTILASSHALTQKEIAERLGGLNPTTVNRWFNGKAFPSMQEGLRLAKLLCVPYDFLADDKQIEYVQVLEHEKYPYSHESQPRAERCSLKSKTRKGFYIIVEDINTIINSGQYFITPIIPFKESKPS